MIFSKIDLQIIKQKNTKRLSESGVVVPDHLPVLDMPDFRTPAEVAKRCVVLAVMLQLHFKAPKDFVIRYLEKNNLVGYLSENEKSLLEVDYEDWDEQSKTNLYWSIEAIWSFTWVGGFHNNLSLDTGVEDTLATFLPNFVENEPAFRFIETFKLRSEKQIIEKLDLFYRTHWLLRQQQINGNSLNFANSDIVIERRKSLEWTCYSSEQWDDICLNT